MLVVSLEQLCKIGKGVPLIFFAEDVLNLILDTVFCEKYLKLHYSEHTTSKVTKYGGFSSPHFPAFGLNTERYGVYLLIQSE